MPGKKPVSPTTLPEPFVASSLDKVEKDTITLDLTAMKTPGHVAEVIKKLREYPNVKKLKLCLGQDKKDLTLRSAAVTQLAEWLRETDNKLEELYLDDSNLDNSHVAILMEALSKNQALKVLSLKNNLIVYNMGFNKEAFNQFFNALCPRQKDADGKWRRIQGNVLQTIDLSGNRPFSTRTIDAVIEILSEAPCHILVSELGNSDPVDLFVLAKEDLKNNIQKSQPKSQPSHNGSKPFSKNSKSSSEIVVGGAKPSIYSSISIAIGYIKDFAKDHPFLSFFLVTPILLGVLCIPGVGQIVGAGMIVAFLANHVTGAFIVGAFAMAGFAGADEFRRHVMAKRLEIDSEKQEIIVASKEEVVQFGVEKADDPSRKDTYIKVNGKIPFYYKDDDDNSSSDDDDEDSSSNRATTTAVVVGNDDDDEDSSSNRATTTAVVVGNDDDAINSSYGCH